MRTLLTLATLLSACAREAAPPATTPGPDAPLSPGVDAPANPVPSASGSTPAPSKAGPAGAACGGIAGFGCASGLYCAFAIEATCGAADQTGVCKAIPDVCTEQYDPVCGCNDKTYSNECTAAREGISVARKGACATATPATLAEGQLCGTRGVAGECGPDLYCKYKSACGATDSGGACVKRPRACTKIYKPVCGCDGKTHGNECTAASLGVSVQHEGACKGS